MGISHSSYLASYDVFTPLGENIQTLFSAMRHGHISLKTTTDPTLSPEPFCASRFEDTYLKTSFQSLFGNETTTRFEMMASIALKKALLNRDIRQKRTRLIVSSTKGNIELTYRSKNKELLASAASSLAARFGFADKPVIVSNACTSGVLAVLLGNRMIQSGTADQVVIVGADTVNAFVLSGFQSFKSLSLHPARPYDASRDGLTIGEGAAAVVLSSKKPDTAVYRVIGGGVANDANHLSGPSRTGQGLYDAVYATLQEAAVPPSALSVISAHGTATRYNDEMEAHAFYRLGLSDTPLHSLKGYIGHTLGAAGLIEIAVLLEGAKQSQFLKTAGYSSHGVSKPLAVTSETLSVHHSFLLKTASGFGGTNAAVLFGEEK